MSYIRYIPEMKGNWYTVTQPLLRPLAKIPAGAHEWVVAAHDRAAASVN